MPNVCRLAGPHVCETGEHPAPVALVGPNPVLELVDAGHFWQEVASVKGAPPEQLCRADGELWPCERMMEARVAAKWRGARR